MSTLTIDPTTRTPSDTPSLELPHNTLYANDRISEETYLAFLETSPTKYHLIEGKLEPMAGASPQHNLIAMNLAVDIRLSLEQAESECDVLGSDQRVRITDSVHYFPDLVVVCGAMQLDAHDGLQNPVALVEILSASTAAKDRGKKFEDYQQIASLQHYILVEQARVSVTHFAKNEQGQWTIIGLYTHLSDTLTLALSGAELALPLSRIYRRVTFQDE